VRYADLDPNQHVNNAVYATYFETSRVSLVREPAHGLTPPGLGWVLVRLDIHFRHELHWPGQIELGLGIVKVGRTSASFDQVVFAHGRCVASARSVTVMVDEATRKPTPLPASVIANMQRWLLRAPHQA
jgi:acyl-CoA thioester hydrolase